MIGSRRPGARATPAAWLPAYLGLGSLLAITRLAGLGRSYWHDEILTVADYVREGPREILAGSYIPNNHELFSLLGWATTELVGESEAVLRLWSVVPFLAGVAAITVWLGRSLGALSGLLYLFFVSFSPLLLDITWQARGYGLAFLAMSVLVVAALEAESRCSVRAVGVVAVAGVVGTLTLPNFLLAYLSTAAALALVRSQLRRAVGVTTAGGLALIGGWYAPHLDDLRESAAQEYGAPIHALGVLTAPFDQILIPAFFSIDAVVLFASVAWLPVIAVSVLLMGSSPLLTNARAAVVLCSGVAGTVAAVWATRVHTVPRFWSFLLVPLLVLVASGTASVLERLRTRPPFVRTLAALCTIGLLPLAHASTVLDVVRLPREAHRDAAAFIQSAAPSDAVVLAYVVQPRDVEFYLGRPVVPVRSMRIADRALCEARQPTVLVEQPWVLPPLRLSCGYRALRSVTFRQYARGGRITVWVTAGEARRSLAR